MKDGRSALKPYGPWDADAAGADDEAKPPLGVALGLFPFDFRAEAI